MTSELGVFSIVFVVALVVMCAGGMLSFGADGFTSSGSDGDGGDGGDGGGD